MRLWRGEREREGKKSTTTPGEKTLPRKTCGQLHFGICHFNLALLCFCSEQSEGNKQLFVENKRIGKEKCFPAAHEQAAMSGLPWFAS